MTPTLISLALRDIPDPDYADVSIVSVPPARRSAIPDDPAVLAAQIFDVGNAPKPVLMLISLRQKLVRLLGVPPADKDVFTVRQVEGPEALISIDDVHLDFRGGVAAQDGLIRVTTVVRLKNWRGRLYFVPVRLLHPIIVRAMVRGAIRRWA